MFALLSKVYKSDVVDVHSFASEFIVDSVLLYITINCYCSIHLMIIWYNGGEKKNYNQFCVSCLFFHSVSFYIHSFLSKTNLLHNFTIIWNNNIITFQKILFTFPLDKLNQLLFWRDTFYMQRNIADNTDKILEHRHKGEIFVTYTYTHV